jgi:hypothetical protein
MCMASRVISHLSLSSKKEEDAADDLLASLTVMAHPTPIVKEKVEKRRKKKAKPKLKHRSRFFFTPTRSFDDELDKSKKVIEPHALTLLTEEVETRKDLYLEELPKILQSHIEDVREFFLTQIAPRTLAVQAGSAQAREVVQRTLNTEIENTQFAQFERMVMSGTQLKMARYIAKYLGLPVSSVSELVSSVQPRKPEMIMFPSQGPTPEERREPPQRVTKKPQVPVDE